MEAFSTFGHRQPATGNRAPGTGHRAPGTGHRRSRIAVLLSLSLAIGLAGAQELGIEDGPITDEMIFDFSVHPIIEMAQPVASQTSARPELAHMRSFSTPYTDGLGRLWSFSIDFDTGVYVIMGAPGTFSGTIHAQAATAMRHEAHQIELARWCQKNPQDLIGCTESKLMPIDWGIAIGIIGIVIGGIISWWSYEEGLDSAADAEARDRQICDSLRYQDSVRQTQLANECRSRSEGRSEGWVFCRSTPVFVEQSAIGAPGGGACATQLQFLRCDESCEALDPYGPLPE